MDAPYIVVITTINWMQLLRLGFNHGRPLWSRGCYPSLASMTYRVISFTMAQVRQGALGFQRQLGTALPEQPEIKVYSVSPFDLDERRRFKDRFGGDIVYFLNETAWLLCEQMDVGLESLAEISEAELPKRRSLVVGMPEPRVTPSST